MTDTSALSAAAAAPVAQPPAANAGDSRLFQLKRIVRDNGPRLGTILERIPTPAVSFYTQYGLPVNLTRDQWTLIADRSRCYSLTLSELIAHPNTHVRKFSGGIRQYLAYDSDAMLVLSPRDTMSASYGPANDRSLTLGTSSGNVRLTPSQYLSLAAMYGTDVVTLMSDELSGDATRTRSMKSVLRTLLWTKQQLQDIFIDKSYRKGDNITIDSGATSSEATDTSHSSTQTSDQSQPLSKKRKREAATKHNVHAAKEDKQITIDEEALLLLASSSPSPSNTAFPYVIAPIVGGSHLDHRQFHLQQLAPYTSLIDGFVINGFDAISAGSDTSSDSESLIACVTKQLPSTKLRAINDCLSYYDLVMAVSHGVDLIHTTLPHRLTQKGVASLWSASEPLSLPTELDLSAVTGRDNSAIVSGCVCYTCQRHTRGYLHHLLRVKEMTAFVLLDHHNWFVAMAFMAEMRALLVKGASDWQAFESRVRESRGKAAGTRPVESIKSNNDAAVLALTRDNDVASQASID